jgi:hypothetical protein
MTGISIDKAFKNQAMLIWRVTAWPQNQLEPEEAVIVT